MRETDKQREFIINFLSVLQTKFEELDFTILPTSKVILHTTVGNHYELGEDDLINVTKLRIEKGEPKIYINLVKERGTWRPVEAWFPLSYEHFRLVNEKGEFSAKCLKSSSINQIHVDILVNSEKKRNF